MSKKRNKSILKDLHLDKPTSHGGWGPDADNGSWNNKTPVNQQIANWLTSMGLADSDRKTARLSEQDLRNMIRNIILEKIYR
tara:strand:- start:413 stop:658 length:246 start_codon:yes stop_codon:yes gene_type:complete